MKATFEISMYPLKDTYEEEIIAFINRLKAQPGIRVEVNGISTQVFGDYDDVMQLFQQETKRVLQSSRAVFVLKIAEGERSPESIPETLK